MESLALVVSILLLICFFSGPLGFFLTSHLMASATTHPIASLLKRTVVIINGLFGSLVSSFFLFAQIPLTLKVISFLSLVLNIWALDREFGGNLTRYLGSTFRQKNE